jgi:protein-tyrosine phosphatase
MKAEIYWISGIRGGRLAVMPRPRGGDWLEDEIKSLRNQGVDTVVSLLTTNEMTELGLSNEPMLCQRDHIEYISYPIADRQVPDSTAPTIELVRRIRTQLKQGKSVAIHCRAGIGRSGLMAACVLVAEGVDVTDAFEIIGTARGTAVPDTQEQKDWAAYLAKNLYPL